MGKEVDYKVFVRHLAETNDPRTFLNSDENHALDVFLSLFQTAKESVRIFAGCLCKHVGNNISYVIALSEFVERGGKLFILLNDYDEEAAKNSSLYKRLAYYASKKMPVCVKKTTARPYFTSDPEKRPFHFTVADDKAYRLEVDIEQRAAECSFNNPMMAAALAEYFDKVFAKEDSSLIDLVALFENGNN